MNCRVRADFPTPPLPTMITLWRTSDVWLLFLPEAMTLACRGQEEDTGDIRRPAGTRRMGGLVETSGDPQVQEETSKQWQKRMRTGREPRGQKEINRET